MSPRGRAGVAAQGPQSHRVAELPREAVPACRHAIIPGAGHMSPLTHPDELARIVLDHLAWTDAGATARA